MPDTTANRLSRLHTELEMLETETFEVLDYAEVDHHMAGVGAASCTSCSGTTSTTSTSCHVSCGPSCR